MKFIRKHLGYTIAIALLLAGAGIALAQNAGQFIASPTGAEAIQIYPANTAANVYANVTQIRDASGLSQQTPLTGFTITIPNNVSVLQLTPAGTLATGTATMAAAPVDGQRAQIFTTQTVTAMTTSANAGQSIVGGLSAATLSANGNVEYIYKAANTTWYRIQ